MKPKINVETSDFAVGQAPQILATSGIGSCVAICLYHKDRRIGALLHIMLPRSEGDHLNPRRFADTGINLALIELGKQSIAPTQLTAKLVGGAQMFKAFASAGNIGSRNVEEIRRILHTIAIPIEAEDIGGSSGRNLEFDLASGLVTIVGRSAP
ncbi:MAG TPA: chemotaxis protein CheD [Candidatus Saccharimonadales bacterium]|nr:chemotaxis protein CheD [Candidatus Saccharimonadales bacterium]